MNYKMFVDSGKFLCYKLVALMVLLLLSFQLYAADPFESLLPGKIAKVSESYYRISYDFAESVKRLKSKMSAYEAVKSDLLTAEENFKIHVFYNNGDTARWHRLYVIEEDGKVYMRIYK